MSIASILTRLSTAKESLANKIVSLGGSISEGDGFEDFSSAMDTIPLGSSATLVSKTITENGVYDPSDDSADGYSSVTVNVSGSGDNGLAKGIIDRSIRNATLPSDLTRIGNYAFNACTLLTLTSLPSGITNIGFGAFSGCNALALTSLPSGITTIEQNAFNGCSSLALTSLPSGLTQISQQAFKGCTNLALTSLPSGILNIWNSAFLNCTSLALTSLPSGVSNIGISAFDGCTSLALTSLPTGIATIYASTFDGCTNLALTSLPTGLTSIGNNGFRNCTSLALTSLPTGLTSIGTSSFEGCTNLALTSLPSGIKTISQKSFKDCTGLTNLEIQYTGTASGTTNKVAIQADAFNGCSNLAVISFPNVLQVPSLANISALAGLPTNYEIRVPSNLLTSWKATTNWKHADVIDHIVAIAEE